MKRVDEFLTAIQNALADWYNKEVYYLIPDGSYKDMPQLDKISGFYKKISENDDAYINSYNKKIIELVEQHGLPDWAPIHRLPLRDEILALLENSIPFSSFTKKSVKEGWLVNFLQKKILGTFMSFFRDEERLILLLSSNINKQCGRVDIIDTKLFRWMNTIEFKKSNIPAFPWDGTQPVKFCK